MSQPKTVPVELQQVHDMMWSTFLAQKAPGYVRQSWVDFVDSVVRWQEERIADGSKTSGNVESAAANASK